MIRLAARAALGFSGAAIISCAARRANALSSGGAVAATIIGGSVVTGSGLRSGAALVGFFLSSTLLGRLPGPSAVEQHRGSKRDPIQVIANGGVAAILSLASLASSERVRTVLTVGLGGAVSAAAADTWATEIGSRSRQRPRSIMTLTPVALGVSGGVTWAGIGASAAGSALIAGMMSGERRRGPKQALKQTMSIACGGVIGSLVDSLLGATLQEVRFCDRCEFESEQHVHRCGTLTHHLRGRRWCNNDVVNAISTAAGAAASMIIVMLGRHAVGGSISGSSRELGLRTYHFLTLCP